ncbi:Crp/Fnr family transcriptional regulator [Chitinophaga niabensis]|uniref:cAMP-binding domain of CRP or a regulatory subunit of cAMP-dependent protein kinases n=1 Tax=Chitinophaga niabensis TaxID=536979 RepID=A0A1N6FAX8_9BACT|nr:Crp/Fnr family transcriptional regulator [Chitinophaga niabensis]SIN92438.1 cAMP-binding domain of CRP or a regulatory subunit of cAMP-dependent protein kinases [Chitinophaga niabensis]
MKKFTDDQIYAAVSGRLNAFTMLPPQVHERIREKTQIVSFKKREIFHRADETCRYCYFIVDGFTMAYTLDKDMEEITSWCMDTGDIITSVISYYTQTPSNEYLVALQDSICVRFHYEDMIAIAEEFPIFYKLMWLVDVHYHMQLYLRDSWKGLDAKDRYIKLQEHFPNIILKAPQSVIASYLGISKFHLSDIRRELKLGNPPEEEE